MDGWLPSLASGAWLAFAAATAVQAQIPTPASPAASTPVPSAAPLPIAPPPTPPPRHWTQRVPWLLVTALLLAAALGALLVFGAR